MPKNLFCLLFAFVLIVVGNQTAKAETIVAGNSCAQLGTSTMATDQKSIVTCLKNDSGVLVWKSNSGDGAPTGAVMAFNLTACPSGWTPLTTLAGRTIIGVGNSGATGATTHALGEIGGEESHTLTVAEMPSHYHAQSPTTLYYDGMYSNQGLRFGGQTAWQAGNGSAQTWTQPSGSNSSHNNMQPYVALLYCQKM